MFYDTESRAHGLRHDPFKALVVPRPIGWVATVGADGVANIAPYSFFNGVSDRPPMVMFSVSGRKDTLVNIERSGECTCSMAVASLRDAMNLTSAAVDAGVDEFSLAGLATAPSILVGAPRVAASPAALECRLWRTLALPPDTRRPDDSYTLVLASVVGVHIDDRFIRDGIVDVAAMAPLARLGYMDYSMLTAETMFTMNRPRVGDDGCTVTVDPGQWDGVYR
ncbi:MAG: flavin reductase family protein [Burkholderiaceae bacterium]